MTITTSKQSVELENPEPDPADRPVDGQDTDELVLQEQPMISVDRLKPDPENPRDDLDLNREFLAGIANSGVDAPIIIRPDPDDPDMCIIVEGERRWAGAVKVGLEKVPYRLMATDDEAKVFLTMYRTNADRHRRNHTGYEQAVAISKAAAAGATKKQIRQETGLSNTEVAYATRAGRLNRDRAKDLQELFGEEPNLEEYAIFQEYEGDAEATERLERAKAYGASLAQAVALIKRERAELAEHERLVKQFEAEGVAVTEDLPDGGLELVYLKPDAGQLDGDQDGAGEAGAEEDEGGEGLAIAAHAACPGHAVYFPQSLDAPEFYCADPITHGHAIWDTELAKRLELRAELIADGYQVPRSWPTGAVRLERLEVEGAEMTVEAHQECPGRVAHIPLHGKLEVVYFCNAPKTYGHALWGASARQEASSKKKQEPEPPRSLKIRANREWLAAGDARRAELENLLRRTSAPKGTMAFLAEMLLRMPRPVKECLGAFRSEQLFTQFTGKSFEEAAEEAAKAKPGRQQVLLLAQVAAALEHEMVGTGERMKTWRVDDGNYLCKRQVAGRYLRFLAEVGIKPTPIEKAVIEGRPYDGADPDQEQVAEEARADDGDSGGARDAEVADEPGDEQNLVA